MKLTHKDYLIILDYYNINIPKTSNGNVNKKKNKRISRKYTSYKIM